MITAYAGLLLGALSLTLTVIGLRSGLYHALPAGWTLLTAIYAVGLLALLAAPLGR